MYFSKTLVVLSIALSALASPHQLRSVNHHALAHRAAIPEATPEPAPVAEPKKIRKRADTSRCRARSSSAAPTTTTLVPPKNVGGDPTTEQPEPTTTEKPQSTKQDPTPTTTKKITTTKQPTPTKGSGGGGGNDPLGILTGPHSGDGTFYGTGLGACGITNNDNDFIVALSQELFDNFPGYSRANPNKNPLCKRMIRATYKGKSVDVMAVDRCVGCKFGDLDFSPAAFKQLASFDDGRINPVTWEWL